MMEKAILTDAKNPLPKYYKANILASLGDYHKAQKVLEELKECAPQESSVHALLGKTYNQLKLYDKAVLHFGIALDLNPSPSDAVKIKVKTPSSLMLHKHQLWSHFGFRRIMVN